MVTGRTLPAVGAVALALVIAVLWHPAASPPIGGEDAGTTGRTIWLGQCAICHGPQAKGTRRAPDISDRGTAAVDFQVRTGRMPLKHPDQRMQRHRPVLDDEQITALVSYTATFFTGPQAGTPSLAGADLTAGNETFLANCSSCHHSAGAGGALAGGDVAPQLYEATPREVREAIRSGPGNMPKFAPGSISDAKVADLAAYVDHLKQPGDRGGFDLGHLGPVPEGLVAVVIGLGAMVLVVRWLGTVTSEDEQPTGDEA